MPGKQRLGPRHAGAFTLVELLVVIAIIGILVALLLPAVQSAREAARRTQCANRFKQVGLAILNYESTYKRFPPGQRRFIERESPFSWSVLILEFMEQGTVHDQIDFKMPLDSAKNKGDAIAPGPVTVVMENYLCPSLDRAHETREPDNRIGDLNGDGDRYDVNEADGMACIDMLGIKGPHAAAQNPVEGNEIYGANRGVILSLKEYNARRLEPPKITTSRIIDGLSNTMMVAECSGRGNDNGMWASGKNVSSIQHPMNLDDPIREGDSVLIAWYDEEVFSDHPGGAHLLLADGSAHFANESIELSTLQAIASRDGGEITGLED